MTVAFAGRVPLWGESTGMVSVTFWEFFGNFLEIRKIKRVRKEAFHWLIAVVSAGERSP